MVVVGYADQLKAFKVLNSWGTKWGDRGYAWIDYAAFQNLTLEGYVTIDIFLDRVASATGPANVGVPRGTSEPGRSTAEIGVPAGTPPDGKRAASSEAALPSTKPSTPATARPSAPSTASPPLAVNTPATSPGQASNDMSSNEIDKCCVHILARHTHAQDDDTTGAFEFPVGALLGLPFWHGFSIMYLQQF